MQTAIELAVFGGALLVLGDATHFTWWGVAMLVLTLCVEASRVSSALKYRVHVLTTVTGITILVAVVGMSVSHCSMLQNAFSGAGPWTYFFGNFALHYYPSLRGLLLCMRADPGTSYNHELRYDAALPLAAYCVLHQPSAIYGCTLPFGPPVLAAFGLVWVCFVEKLLKWWLHAGRTAK